jgi:hypothetical protein
MKMRTLVDARRLAGRTDPNPYLTAKIIPHFRKAGIDTALFSQDLAAQVEELNRAFITASGDSMPSQSA